jgi:hypothetical protein
MEAKYGKRKRKGEREQEYSLLNDKRKTVQKEINARKIWTKMVTERMRRMTEREQNEKKKEYLNRYKNAAKKYQSLKEQEEELILEVNGPKGIEYDNVGMPKGSSRPSDISDYIVKVEEFLRKIDDKKKEMQQIRLEIEEKIADVEDGTQSKILYLRYIKFMKWEDICVELNCSWRQVHNTHSKALKNLNID